jgi:palmitoyltransferase
LRSGSAGHDSLERRRRSQEQSEALKEAAAECSTLIESNSPVELVKYLDSLASEIKVNQIINEEGQTLLHMCAFANKATVFTAVMARAKSEMFQYDIADWVNRKTAKDEFTALHYASFKGNLHILKGLMENGADMYAVNLYGLNVLHLAAQGDQPLSLYYFKS